MNDDIFTKLKSIAAGGMAHPLPTIWTHEIDNPLIGRIKGFSRFQHDKYGIQETVIVELESGELVSAILNDYLIEGMRRQRAEIEDFVLIQLMGKDLSNQGHRFNIFNLVIHKA